MERVAFLKAADDRLEPVGIEARAVLDRINLGEQVRVEIYRERAGKLASKVQLTFERLANCKNMRVRNVKGWVMAMTGRADVVEIADVQVLVPWSTSPRDMTQDALEVFWQDAQTIIRQHILPTLEDEEAKAVLNMIGE